MAFGAHRREHRSPARAESDGVFGRKGEMLAITERAEDYAPGDLRDLGLGRKRTAHWNRGGSEITCQRAIHDRA